MKKLREMIIAAATGLLALTAACGPATSTADELSTAEQAIETKHYDAALKICDKLSAMAESQQLSASELARLSIIYMRLSETDNDHDCVGQATQTYLRAYAANADSARAFYAALPLDMSAYVEMMASLSQALTSPPSLDDIDEGWEAANDSTSTIAPDNHAD
jgi:tetratricopeptide (TPR) repeat protein